MILDTTFLIDVLRGDEEVVEWERDLDENGTGFATSISVLELWEGIQRADASDAERERVRRLLDGIHHADFDAPSAMTAGEVSAALTDTGQEIDVEDVMIGAIALRRDQPVLTRNAEHFERIENLDVETY